MRTTILIVEVFFSAVVLVGAATNEPMTTLQKGLFEEEANHNLGAAIQAYQAVVEQFNKDRKLAATAIFRLGECYRKQGATNEAAVEYQRVLREFGDQTELVALSRTYLAAAGQPTISAAGTASPTSFDEAEAKRIQALIRDSPDLINANNQSGYATLLNQAAAGGHLVVAGLLLDNGADTEAQGTDGTCLHYACAAGHKAMVELLLSKHLDINAADRQGKTALDVAAEKGFKSIVELLVQHGAEVNAKRADQATPLHFAALQGFKSIAEFLIAHGADVNANASWGGPGRTFSGTALDIAAERGDYIFAEILLANKANPNSKRVDGMAPIHLASDPRLLRLLIDHGADVDARESTGTTALMLVAGRGNKDALEILLAHKADPNAKNSSGWTPLHHLASSLQNMPYNVTPAMAESLLAAGADVNSQDNQGRTPLQLTAVVFGSGGNPIQAKVAALLRKHGALENPPDFSAIRVTRRGLEQSIVVFRSDTNGVNRFTLAEALLNCFNFPPGQNRAAGGRLPFPDLTRITITRFSKNKPAERNEISVNMLSSTNGIDCTKDVELQFGDEVDVPEREHALSETGVGITDAQWSDLTRKCLKRKVTFMIKGEPTEITLFGEPSTYLANALSLSEVRSVLRSSSDFSRIRVRRIDPVTHQVKEFVRDEPKPGGLAPVGSYPVGPGPLVMPWDDLWLRDGDIVEVPDK